MAKILELIEPIKGDFLVLMGLITAVGQLASFGKLFSFSTTSDTIYIACVALLFVMCCFSVSYFRRARSLARYSSKRRIYKILGWVYIALALIALLPAAYRWRYIHTEWIPPDSRSEEPEIGFLFGGLITEARAEIQKSLLEVNIYLDPLRTSLECLKTRNAQKEPKETFNIYECAEFGITKERLQHIVFGNGISEDDIERFDFERENGAIMQSAFEALKNLANYRGKSDPLLENGSKLMFLVSQSPGWKKKLLAQKLLPNADEWQQLTKEYPNNALALRKFIVEWIGYLDPLFHVTFRNRTSELIEISKIRYRATARRGGIEADLIGAYTIPRYLLEIQEGTHEDELHPPIQVPSNGSKEVDFLVRLLQPDPGVTYDISLEFLSKNPTYRVVVPTFAVAFMRSKQEEK